MREAKACRPCGRKRKNPEPLPPKPRKPLSILTIRIPPDPECRDPIPADVKRPGLRRTPRRIILRIRKDFLFHNQILKKTRRKNTSAAKENMCSVVSEAAPSGAVLPEQPVKKKRGRKYGEKSKKNCLAVPVRVPVKDKPSVRGRRGRPRGRMHSNIQRSFLFRNEERLLPAADVLSRSPLPWNFSPCPNEFFHLEQFRPSSRILLSPAHEYAERKPVFQVRQFLRDPNRTVSPTKHNNRPTVILLKEPKHRYPPNQPSRALHGYERYPEINGATLDFRHEASHHNMPPNGGVPREMFLSERRFSLPERKGYASMAHDPTVDRWLIQPPNQPSIQSCDNASNQTNSSSKPFLYPDTLNRKLIVDSIRVLYALDTDLW